MVNPGHRSRGCDRCRSQKVKCDEGQPRCRRCSDRGHKCEYTSKTRAFQSMNGWAQTTVTVRVREATEKRAAVVGQSACCAPCQMPRKTGPKRAVSGELSRATTLFLEQFVYHSDHVRSTNGLLRNLPAMYERRSSPIFLKEAVHAPALAYSANVLHQEHLLEMAGKAYRKSIIQLNTFLNSADSAGTNEALSAIILLGLYELISGERPAERSWYHAHARGLRLVMLNGTDIDQTLAPATFRLICSEDLAVRRKPSIGLDALGLKHASWLDEATSRVGYLTVDLSASTKALQDSSSRGEVVSSSQWLQLWSALTEALDICNDCFDRASPDWLRQTSSDNAGSERTDWYPSLGLCVVWNYFRCMQLHLRHLMIDIHETMVWSARPTAQEIPRLEDIRRSVFTVVEDIAASCKYQLGEVCAPQGVVDHYGPIQAMGRIWLIWTLQMMCDIPGLDQRHKQWTFEIFGRVGDEGIRHGHSLRDLYSNASIKEGDLTPLEHCIREFGHEYRLKEDALDEAINS